MNPKLGYNEKTSTKKAAPRRERQGGGIWVWDGINQSVFHPVDI